VENLFSKAKQYELKISALQEKEMGGGLSVEELQVLRGYLTDYHTTLRLQEILWKQKSRIQWLLGGDANSSFFHKAVTVRRRTNCNQSVSNDDGVTFTNYEEIKGAFRFYFMQRWTGPVLTSDVSLPPAKKD